MPTFKTATGAIYYEIYGPTDKQHDTLVLLHNFMSTGRAAWGSMVSDLAERYRVLLPDLPGHGRSVGYPAEFNYREMGRQLVELLRAEHATQGHLAGVSAGGMIAQWLVHDGLIHPKSLTLVSTTYSNNPATTGADGRVTPERFRAGKRWLEATARLHDPHHYEGYFDDVLLANFRLHTPQNTIDLELDDLRAWSMPVCIIHGAEDEFFPARIGEQMAGALANAELHLIPEQTHALIFRRPWAVKRILMDFLASQDRAPGS
jgi:pimeloyl-ACP methyl ester carboxylesterase